MRVAVTGGRDRSMNMTEEQYLYNRLHALKPTLLLHGGATGIDSHVAAWVADYFPALAVRACPANWRKHGRKAGPIRNREMLKDADLLIAFDGGRGTADCVRAAKELGVKVEVVCGVSWLQHRAPSSARRG